MKEKEKHDESKGKVELGDTGEILMILQSEKKSVCVFMCSCVGFNLWCLSSASFFNGQSLPHLINQPATFKMYRSVKRSLVLQTPMTLELDSVVSCITPTEYSLSE